MTFDSYIIKIDLDNFYLIHDIYQILIKHNFIQDKKYHNIYGHDYQLCL